MTFDHQDDLWDWLQGQAPILTTDLDAADRTWELIQGRMEPAGPHRHPRVIAVAVAAALLAACAAVWHAGFGASTNAEIFCYRSASLQSSRWAGAVDGDPISTCTGRWADPDLEDLLPGTAPPLIACVNVNGRIAVFPGDDQTCDLLQLQVHADPDLGTVDQDIDVAAYTRALVAELSAACTDRDTAYELAHELLGHHGMEAWTVRLLDAPPEACAAPVISPRQRTISISATPPPN